MQAVDLYREGLQLINKHPLLSETSRPAISQFVLATGGIEFAHCATNTFGRLKRGDDTLDLMNQFVRNVWVWLALVAT